MYSADPVFTDLKPYVWKCFISGSTTTNVSKCISFVSTITLHTLRV